LQISDTANGNQSVTATEIETIDHSSLPLPSAAEFRAFEDACPGAGIRILELFEKQVEHRCNRETRDQENNHRVRMAGIAVGFLTIVIFAIIAVIFALCDRQTEALVAIIAPMVAFAVAALRYTAQK
jgi:uncharacterized membrane protein